MNPTVERDAQEFGLHAKMKGWRMGLLVARCVQPGRGQGRRTSAPPEQRLKTSGAAFAAAAGVGRNTVAAYLAAWDAAAQDGIVPTRAELEPGVDPELDFGAFPPWDDYYVPPGRGWRSPAGGDDEWYTRPEIVEAAREVLGTIDLDPASSARAQEVVRAARYFTIEDDGLAQVWRGRVFLNPPFSRAKEFGEKLLNHYDHGQVKAAVMVVNAYSFDTRWFRPFWKYAICVSGRAAFYKPGERTGTPAVWAGFVYLGRGFNPFVERFSQLGQIVKDPSDFEWRNRFSVRPSTRATP